ncbi:hypothetical protein JC525_01470 [Alteromonas sp. IB21]|uniref:nucleoside-diphosphate sugar epimerase/dehydratase n=1 Tax=Alteromonas sp. IB21 TaxID=2779369 RepID=UPI0018E8CF1B|nr:hypothetical protein [Alteromonas sp. IB21]MBJ2127599.1 hypothetical protein [Alteromonas sp. IB21]
MSDKTHAADHHHLIDEIVAGLLTKIGSKKSADDKTAPSDLLCYYKQHLYRCKNKTKCGFWVQRNAAMNHMFELFCSLKEYAQIEVLAIMDIEEAKTNPQWLIESNWLDVPFLLCREKDFQQLDGLDIVFIQESNFELSFNWPTNVKRIGCQHGIDVKLSKTLNEYGGCLEFDYILAAQPVTCVNKQAFSGYFPRALRQASSDALTIIPFGSIKFDKFYQVYRQCSKKNTAIIYHLSNLALEATWVVDQIASTVTFLLSHFPEHEIIFRPFPEDFSHPKIASIVLRFRDNPRFTFSQSPSYIGDYSRGVAMVCHRQYESHLYPLVTGNPMLVFKPDGGKSAKEKAIFSLGELKERLSAIIKGAKDEATTQYQNSVICNPGNSVGYLVDNLHYILKGIALPEWQEYTLDLIESVDKCLEQYQRSYQPFNKLALAALKKYPEKIDYAFIAADSLSRRTEKEFDVNPGLALLYLRKALNVVLSIAELNDANSEKLASWMTRQGTYILGMIEQLCSCLETPLLETEKALIQQFGKNATRTIPSQYAQKLSVRSCHNGQQLCTSSNAILYGSGELARQFIVQQRVDGTYDIVGVVDSSPSRHGCKFEEYIISQPNELLQLDVPIIICSLAFAEEIYLSLCQLGISTERMYKIF